MDIGTIASNTFSAWNIVSFVFAICGFIPFIVLIIGAFTRLGKAGWRFGLALFGKKIMIVADCDDFNAICLDLTESGLIKEKNITRVSKKNLSYLKDVFMVIIVYGYLEDDEFTSVINEKSSRCGLIVYCPPNKRLSDDEKSLLNSTPFTTLCNFRGRLVNDVLLMMLSTSFKKKDWEKQKERQA